MKKVILSFVSFFLCIANFAEVIEVNGIYYCDYDNDDVSKVCVYSSPSGYSGSIVIPASIQTYFSKSRKVTMINARAFEGCKGLTSITIPNSVTSIGERAFYGCTGLTYINIPNSVTNIGNCAFQGCTALTSVSIPNSVTSIEGRAFQHCSGLTSVTIPNSVTSIGAYAFCNCAGLTSVIIPNSVTSIGAYAFEGCTGLSSVTIGNSVTSIGGSAFYGCSGLTSVTIPNSVTSIGERAFIGCTGLTSVKYTTTRPFGITDGCFPQEVYDNATLIVAKGYIPTVGSLDGWRKFKNIVEAGAAPKQDVNGDGKVNTADVVAIYEYIINGE